MNAMLNQQTVPAPEIIDFVAFRDALPRRAATDVPRGDAVIVAFPAARTPSKPDMIPAGSAVVAAAELSAACALLVESFRAMHVAVTDLQETCRVLDSGAGEIHDQAGAVLIGIAQLSSTTERFQNQLDATIDAAFL
jgi:hypothetical protein